MLVIVMTFFCHVVWSLAETFKIPSAQMSKQIVIFGTPLGIRGIPHILNSSNKLLSRVLVCSPSYIHFVGHNMLVMKAG